MKVRPYIPFVLSILAAGGLAAQAPESLIEPVTPAEAPAPPPPPLVPQTDAAPSPEAPFTPPPSTNPDLAPPPPVQPQNATEGTAPFAPLEQQKKEMTESSQGFIIKDGALNDIFQFLAKAAGRQYFHNSKIAGPEYLVTGHLNDGNPLQQMEELAFMYGLSLHTKGNTIYALTQAQLSQLPSAEFHYQLKYLRPTDIEQIKELIKPMLSPGSGIVNFEPKTNTIIIIDSAHKIEQARELLHGIDRTKGQIIVETKIFRVNSNAADRVGVDWSGSLGENGVSLAVARDLGSIFGLPSQTSSLGGNLVLDPIAASGLLRALADGRLAKQVSNPTLITEDNEQATISIIDRIPIITRSITQSGTSGAEPTVTEEVRYKIDAGDKAITEDPLNHREIGISLVVTPTLLPDGTVRMKMRPRSAQVAEYVQGSIIAGIRSQYPRVTESMVETLARVPDGHSLIVGGFYGEIKNNDKTKVPLLGDIPVINFFFKSKEASSEQTSLVFMVTPKSYNPSNRSANSQASRSISSATALDCDHDWVDPYNPGPAHEPNLRRSVRGLQPSQAPLYPLNGDAVAPTNTHRRMQTNRGK